jgi:hypothetical protein
LEKGGYVLGDAVGPKAIEVDKWCQVFSFRGKFMVGGLRVSGVIFALKRVTEDDDELKGGVGGNGKVEVASGHFVNFVDDEDVSVLEKGGLPGGDAPSVGWGNGKVLFPVRSKFGGGDGDSMVAKEFMLKEASDGSGFSTAGESSEMDERDGSGRGDVN